MVYSTTLVQSSLQDKNRSRTLEDYSNQLGFSSEDGLGVLLDDLLGANKTVVWVDIGCGNQVAQRQAKYMLGQRGIDPDRLETYGFDLFGFNWREARDSLRRHEEKRLLPILERAYEGIFLQGSAHSLDWPKRPHLVTAVQVFQWDHNPLLLIEKAIQNLRLGGILACNRLYTLHVLHKSNTSPLRQEDYRHARPLFWSHIPPEDLHTKHGLKSIASTATKLIAKKVDKKTSTLDFEHVRTKGIYAGANKDVCNGFEHYYNKKGV